MEEFKKYHEFKNDIEFRKYLKEHGFDNQKEYFLKVYDKRDPYTNEAIPFDNKIQYLQQNFMNRSNINRWIIENPVDGEKYLREKLEERKKEKELKYALNACDLRSLKTFPVLSAIKKAGFKWTIINQDLGLELKYDYNNIIFNPIEDKEFFIDTKEQKPLEFDKSAVLKLAYGDYVAKNSEGLVFVERKSISDLWTTLSNGFERFKREIERAKQDGVYITVVVEYPIYKAITYNHQKRFSKSSAEFIFSRIRSLHQDYKNVQFVFSGDRRKSKRLIEFIFSNEKDIPNWDLQFLLDLKVIKL